MANNKAFQALHAVKPGLYNNSNLNPNINFNPNPIIQSLNKFLPLRQNSPCMFYL